VVTEVLQFFIKLVVCVAIGWIAFHMVSADMLRAAVPHGWESMGFGLKLDLDWDAVARAARPENRVIATSATATIASEGYSYFALFMGLVTFQGILKAMAGPAPNYDMQRLLSARSPSEAAKISGFVNIVLLFPRYLMIAGMAVLAVVFIGPEWTRLQAEATAAGKPFSGDFDAILPWVVHKFLPPGLLGLTLAGLLSAFMATYSASLNAAPAYVVNDIYKKYIRPDASEKTYVRLSYLTSFLFAVIAAAIGWQLTNFNDVITWITTGLYGGYTVANVVKWYWWRLNGTGYAASMAVGVAAAMAMAVYKDAAGHGIDGLAAFPWLMLACLLVAVIGSYLTQPTDMTTLKAFYKKTRPWGFWGPVLKALREDEPDAQPNRDLGIDIFNILIGVVWQTALTASAIFLIIHAMTQFWVSAGIAAVITICLKFTWWDRLRDEPR
jgi:Na+/proline symporter